MLSDMHATGIGDPFQRFATDRKLEGTDIPWSKQVAPNIVAPSVSAWTHVAEHWDECSLDSWVTLDGERAHCQSASVQRVLDAAGDGRRCSGSSPRRYATPVRERHGGVPYNVVKLGSGITN
ncbi:MAG: DUF2848 domain-containing protein [Acidimicrobiia bacterium]|nr:DUF2848 domain-containing protein [Acidimicrobiia bacterium]